MLGQKTKQNGTETRQKKIGVLKHVNYNNDLNFISNKI